MTLPPLPEPDTAWSRVGADAIIELLMPVLRAAAKTGATNNVMLAYAGALGAWHGSLQADAGPEFGPRVAELLVQKVLKISVKEQLN